MISSCIDVINTIISSFLLLLFYYSEGTQEANARKSVESVITSLWKVSLTLRSATITTNNTTLHRAHKTQTPASLWRVLNSFVLHIITIITLLILGFSLQGPHEANNSKSVEITPFFRVSYYYYYYYCSYYYSQGTQQANASKSVEITQFFRVSCYYYYYCC